MADGGKQDAVDLMPVVSTTEISPSYGPRDITRQWLRPDGRLWNEDIVLTLEAGGDLKLYKDLLRDDHVHSTFEQRRTAVTAAAWSVTPGTEDGASEEDPPSARAQEAADFVEQNLLRIGFDRVTSLMLFSVFYGYAVSEIIWDVIDWKGSPRFQWKAMKPRDRQRFLFQPDGRCYLNVGGNDSDVQGRVYCDGTLDDPYFWILSTGDDYGDNPYGLGLANRLFWLVRFKRDVIRWWMIYNEKFAQPTVVGKFQPGSTPADKNALLRAITNILTQSGVTIPDTMEIELLEASRTGSSDYGAFIGKIDEAISKIVVGQTLTTQVGSTGGNRALGQVHEGVASAIQKSDADLTCESLNDGPIAWLVERNFGPDCPKPRVKRDIEEKTDLTQLATQIGLLFPAGIQPSLAFVEANWGSGFEKAPPPPAPVIGGPGGLPKKADPNAPKFTSLDFAAAMPKLFPDQDALDGAVSDLGSRMASLAADLIDPLVDYAASTDPTTMLAELQTQLPGWKPQQLHDAVSQVVFVSKTFGRSFAGRS